MFEFLAKVIFDLSVLTKMLTHSRQNPFAESPPPSPLGGGGGGGGMLQDLDSNDL
jgi:hypothetical protein